MSERILTDLEEHQISILYHVKKTSITELAKKFSVHRRTIDRALKRRANTQGEEEENAA